MTRGSTDHHAGGMYVNGMREFASGGFASGIYQGVQGGIMKTGSDGLMHRFAEAENGVPWEAYISGKPSERSRNRQIWQTTGDMLGITGGATSTVHVPTHVTVVDADNRLIGTMEVVADGKIDGYTAQQARENRRAGH